MTVLLVLLTIVIFLGADHVVQKVRLARAMRASSESSAARFNIPEGVSLASNNLWMTFEKGIATIGLDEFLGQVLGAVESISLPDVGAAVEPEVRHIVLRDRDRSIRLAAPVRGRIVEINPVVLRHPATARQDPYGAGWLMRIAVGKKSTAGATLHGAAARAWLSDQAARAKEFIGTMLPQLQLATMQDGGSLVEGALKQCNQGAWEEFERRFATLGVSQPITR
ncbi:MAG TPA: glycine cleavage system protein H [Bacteroidota bacterium]|nr:glycine cleavage system protein H [Bacteroidota bacterium]